MDQNAYLLNMFAAGFGGLMGFAIVILITTIGILGFGFLMLRLRSNVVGVMNDAADSVINNFVMPKTSANMSAAMAAGDTSVNSAVNGAMGAAGQAGRDGMAGGTGVSTATIAAGGAAAGGGSRMLSGNPSGSIAGYDSHVSFATGSGSAGDVSVTSQGAMAGDVSASSFGQDAGLMQASSDKKGTFVAGREVGTSLKDSKEQLAKVTETVTDKKDSADKAAAMPAGVATGVATETSELSKASMAEKSDKAVATAALKADSLAAFANSAAVGTSPGVRALHASHFGPMSGNMYSDASANVAATGLNTASAFAEGAQAGEVRAVRADSAGGLAVAGSTKAQAVGVAGANGAAGAAGGAGTAGEGGSAGNASAATDVRNVAGNVGGSHVNVAQGTASSYVNAKGGSAGRAGANGGRGSAAAGMAGKNGTAGAGGSAGVGEGAEAANVRAVAVGSNVAVHPSATAMAGAPGTAGAGGSAGAVGAAAMQQNGQMYRQSAMQRGQVDANGRPVNGQVTGKVFAEGKLQADGENRRVSQVNQVNRSSSVTDRMMAGTPSGASGSYGRQNTNISMSQHAQQMQQIQQQGSYRNSAMQAGGTERDKMVPGQGTTPATQAQYMNSTQVRTARQVGGQQMSTQGNNGGGQYGKVDATLHDAPAGTYQGGPMNVRNTVANNYQQGAPVAAGGDGVPGSGGGSFGNPRSGGAQYPSAGYRGSQAGGRYSKGSRYMSSSEMRGYMSSRQGGGVVSPSLRNAPNSGGRNATQSQYAMQRDRNRTQNPNAGRSSAEGYGAASGPMPAKGLDVGGNMAASSGQSGDWITAPAEPTGSFANKSGRKRPTHKDNTAYV